MTDKLLMERQDHAVEEENEERRSQAKEAMEKWGEQLPFEDKVRFARRLSNAEARKEGMKLLYGGVIEEDGLGAANQQAVKEELAYNDELIMAEIEKEGSLVR